MSNRRKGKALKIIFDKSQFSVMILALHELVMVLAAAQIKPTLDTAQNARLLRTFGLSRSEIGGILDISRQSVDLAFKKRRRPGRRKGR
jgi:hypothetical protein